ncbi:MAG: hypothetical protein V7731_01815 [Amphritea sp.]
MSAADKAKLEFESGQTAVPMAKLTDSGNKKLFTAAAGLWSGVEGSEYNVKPNGLATGGVASPAVSVTNDLVDVTALTCYLAGVLTAVGAGVDTAITRAATLTHQISSVTVTAAGALAVLAGTEGNAFVETRGVAGGPPYIPTDSIEVAQVRLASGAAAVITASEIFSTVGLHTEKYDYPVMSVDELNGEVTFAAALPAIHTGDISKEVWASYATPDFFEVVDAYDYVPPEESISVSSKAVYNSVKGSTSASLSQGSFNTLLKDGVTDDLVAQQGQKLWFRFYPNRNKAPYILCQGVLSFKRSFPSAGDMVMACQISAETKSTGFSS